LEGDEQGKGSHIAAIGGWGEPKDEKGTGDSKLSWAKKCRNYKGGKDDGRIVT